MSMLNFKLSVCIPTYNRARHLTNCLESIKAIPAQDRAKVEICISDNGSSDETPAVVEEAQRVLNIKYNRNSENIGIPRNFRKVVSMATGTFTWLIGDDDLLLPYTFSRILKLIEDNADVDFFYVNSYHLTTEYVFSFPQPFQTVNLPAEMKRFTTYNVTGRRPFLSLIDPEVSFDFLGGMFLAVFRRANWVANVDCLDESALLDNRTFSHFDNTFPHVKVFANAFAKSEAYFQGEPLSVCLTGAREWSPMYPLIHSVRFVEALEEYRKNGLGIMQYLRCRNFTLDNFVSDICAMMIYGDKAGRQYINPFYLWWRNALYPNTYLSLFYFLYRKVKGMIEKRGD